VCKSEKIILLKRGEVITPFLKDCLLICSKQMFDFAFLLVFLAEYYLGDEIKEEEMQRACGTYWRGWGHDGVMIICCRLLLEKLGGKRPLAKVDVHGKAWKRLM
jgi:hypothetical protein